MKPYVCDGCALVRPTHARRWFFVYPDISDGKLEPIAVYCPSCGEALGLRRGGAR